MFFLLRATQLLLLASFMRLESILDSAHMVGRGRKPRLNRGLDLGAKFVECFADRGLSGMTDGLRICAGETCL